MYRIVLILSSQFAALTALADGWLLPTRLGASAVLAGLDPAIHAVPLRDGSR